MRSVASRSRSSRPTLRSNFERGHRAHAERRTDQPSGTDAATPAGDHEDDKEPCTHTSPHRSPGASD